MVMGTIMIIITVMTTTTRIITATITPMSTTRRKID